MPAYDPQDDAVLSHWSDDRDAEREAAEEARFLESLATRDAEEQAEAELRAEALDLMF